MVSAAARGERAVRVSRRSERDDILAALKAAEGVTDVRDLAMLLWGQAEDLRQQVAAAHDREAAVRAGLQDVMRRASGSATQVLHLTGDVAAAEVRTRTALAERDEARAAEDAAVRRALAAEGEVRALKARLALLAVGPPRPAAAERVGQVTGAEVRLWVRQTRALSALRDVPAERWDRDDAAPLRRQLFRLQQHAPGAGRAALSERALELARTLGGA